VPFPLTRDQLDHLYTDQGLTDEQIAIKIGGHTGTVNRKRKQWGIRTLRRWERYRFPPIEGQQRPLLIGSMRALERTTPRWVEKGGSDFGVSSVYM
jgi:hypothetical protein